MSIRTRRQGRRTSFFCAAMLTALLTACLPFGEPRATICDGISSELGGCDPDRPTYAGETCDEIAREFGNQVDARSLAIYDGPDDPAESKAVRAWHLVVVAMSLANKRMRDLGIVDECGADEFMVVAETQLSTEFTEKAGVYLYDAEPRPYEEWRAEVMKVVRIIDQEEEAPYFPESPDEGA